MAAELDLDQERVIAVLRPPPEVTLYYRGARDDAFAATLARLLDEPGIQAVVLPRTDSQREALRGGGAIVPERPVDGPSLVALSDLVVSAGGTMNREAAALGVPAYTPFAARLGAVDRALIAQGRLRRLEDPAQIPLVKRSTGDTPSLRDPDELIDLILDAAAVKLDGR